FHTWFTINKPSSTGAPSAYQTASGDGPHTGGSLPACSATMYAAYQLGQSASRSPVRFSCSPCAASARRSALARSLTELYAVSAASTRPGNRVVTSCSSQPLPSGSVNVAYEP